ncbi:hypothetical protein BGZ80_011088 [Entomortierella chlamydospora]|uniref:Uncharacterized protein n=1 Tax=Entomortierella chlamydospora TaxID=101097 RepID=A0A9P6T3N5_9FUNG|nr:hypothetical protein BGZ79_006727 [Entomortierella chlamydospora]KAG0022807.1 hypothetical protein BGZ80_011088 [Entomortierella chlamydospora]
MQSLRPEPVSTGSLYCVDEGSTNHYYERQDIGPIFSQSDKSQNSGAQTLIVPEIPNPVNGVYSSTLQEEPATDCRGSKRKREEEGKLEQQPQDVLLQPTKNVPIQLMKRQRGCSSESVDAAAPPPPPPPPPTPMTLPRCCTLSSNTVEIDAAAEWGATSSFQAKPKVICFISIKIAVLGYALDT